MRPPTKEDPGAAEGNLGQLSNEDWLASHRSLIESGAIPEHELAYLYDPDRDPDTVTVDDLTVDHDPKEPS